MHLSLRNWTVPRAYDSVNPGLTAAVAVNCCRTHLTAHRGGKAKTIEFNTTAAVCVGGGGAFTRNVNIIVTAVV